MLGGGGGHTYSGMLFIARFLEQYAVFDVHIISFYSDKIETFLFFLVFNVQRATVM